MDHIRCFVIHYVAEKIGKKLWHFLKSRATDLTSRLADELPEMIGLDRALRKIAIGMGLTLLIGGIVICLCTCQDKARIA
jgi:hypothetical protein